MVYLVCYFTAGEYYDDRPLANQIVPKKAAKDENRPERFRVHEFRQKKIAP